ncbi:MAG: hypothetical protein P4L33_12865 [Capsulimonadaceae bacterium]|nr:hypothetical protein [Capsulimonadaceae bacterium]
MNPETPLPGPARQQGPSCWAVGGVSCLVLIILGMILLFVGVHQALKSKDGHQFVGQIRALVHNTSDAVECEEKLRAVYGAIGRYRAKNGAYPADIKSLVPKYLPQATSCHCSLDPKPDPANLTFLYVPPTAASKPGDAVLSFTWSQQFAMGGKTSKIDTLYYFTVSGKEMVRQTSTDFDGRSVVTPPREQAGSPPL